MHIKRESKILFLISILSLKPHTLLSTANTGTHLLRCLVILQKSFNHQKKLTKEHIAI